MVVQILMFSACLAFALVFLATAIAGIKNGKVYYEPNCPPVPIRGRPVAFVALCSLYLALGSGAIVAAVLTIRPLIR